MILPYNGYMNDCIFCKIVNKKIPTLIIYEDDKLFGFLDINPVTKGHSLLIPKEHHVWIHETPDEIISNSFVVAKKIIKKMKDTLGCDFVQISVVGKDVPHFHIHLIPRHLNDPLPEYHHTKYENDEEKEKIALQIKNAL